MPRFRSVPFIVSMAAIVPKANDGIVGAMVVADYAQCGGAQEEEPSRCRFQTEPAGGEHVEKVAAGNEQHIAVDGADPVDDPVGPGGHLRDRFAARATVAEQFPAGTLLIDLRRRLALIVAVVPFNEVVIDPGDSSETGQFTGTRRPPERAGEHLGKGQTFEPLAEPARVALAAKRWVRQLVFFVGIGFHPDTPFPDYFMPDGKPSFTPEQCQLLESGLKAAWRALDREGLDLYTVAYRAQRVLLRQLLRSPRG